MNDTGGSGVAIAIGCFVAGVLLIYFVKFIIYAIRFLLKKKNKT
jgi:hypothetical protein